MRLTGEWENGNETLTREWENGMRLIREWENGNETLLPRYYILERYHLTTF